MRKEVTEQQLKFLIETKVNKLRREQSSAITCDQVEQTLMNSKWQGKIPAHLSVVASDIDTLTVEDVVNYITRDGVPSEYDFDRFIEGE